MPNTIARRFAVEATKSSVSSSSLSKVKTAGAEITAPLAWTASNRALKWWRLLALNEALNQTKAHYYLSQKTLKFSAKLHVS